METPAWILVIILSVTLFIFLLVAIILVIALIGVTKEAKKIVLQGQNIAETATDIAENVRDFTTVGGLVKYVVDNLVDTSRRKRGASSSRKKVENSKEETKGKAKDE